MQFESVNSLESQEIEKNSILLVIPPKISSKIKILKSDFSI